jgi:hypothetical protein
MEATMQKDKDTPQPVSLWQVTVSIFASFFGVQSDKNRERDFVHGKPIHYITIGLVSTVLFIIVLIGIVKLVLSFTGV